LMAINRASPKAEQPSQVGALFKLADEFKAHFSATPCKPYFVGVWDTVSSVGWIENPLRPSSDQISGARPQAGAQKTSSRFGLRAFPATSVAVIQRGRAACRKSRSNGCCERRRQPAC